MMALGMGNWTGAKEILIQMGNADAVNRDGYTVRSFLATGIVSRRLCRASSDLFSSRGISMVLLSFGLTVLTHVDAQMAHWAAKGGNIEALQELAGEEWGFDVAKPTQPGGLTPLHLAAAAGHLDIVEWLLAKIGKPQRDR
jgi:ankyrin repeat protein